MSSNDLWERYNMLDHENKVLRAALEHWKAMFEPVSEPGTGGDWIMQRTNDALEFSNRIRAKLDEPANAPPKE